MRTAATAEPEVCLIPRGPPSAGPLTLPRVRRLLTVVPRSEITRVPIHWLWKPYIQRNALTCLTGDPGVGKSTLVVEICAALSTGRPLPGMTDPYPPVNSWIMNVEDNAADTTAWRIDNQGGDPDRIFLTDSPMALSPEVIRDMAAVIAERSIQFISIDPLQSWMGSKIDMNRANEVRGWSDSLRVLAMEFGISIMLNRHRRKTPAGQEGGLYSGIGSIDTTAGVRSEIFAIRDRNDVTYLMRGKGNVGTTGHALAYRLDPSTEPDNDHGVLVWCGDYIPPAARTKTKDGKPVTISLEPRNLGKARAWLRGYLEAGPKKAGEVIRAAGDLGFSPATLKRAKLGIAVSRQIGKNDWVWELGVEADPGPPPPDCSDSDMHGGA